MSKVVKSPIAAGIEKLNSVKAYINSQMFERSRETEGILLALLAGSSCLFIGEPGTGKTRHIRLVCEMLGLSVFDTLISETTKPDSIFGPADVPALAKGTQRTKIKGYAPDSEVLFFDEVFKAGGIVLNPLLWLINEHQYRNGDDGIIQCPIKAVFAASNEIPTDTALKPIYDRFLLRFNVRYLRSVDSLNGMLDRHNLGGVQSIKVPEALTRAEIDLLIATVPKVVIPQEIRNCVFNLRDQVDRSVNVKVSDRRLVKSFQIMQARALLNNRKEVSVDDLDVLSNLFWDTIEQVSKVRSIVMAACNTSMSDLIAYEELAEDVWQNAVRTGELDAALVKLEEMKVTAAKFTTEAGKEVLATITSYWSRLSALTEQRGTLVLLEVDSPEDGGWFKVSSACDVLWSAKQLRSVGFKHYRKGGYWWQGAYSSSASDADKDEARKDLIDLIQTRLGVLTVINTL